MRSLARLCRSAGAPALAALVILSAHDVNAGSPSFAVSGQSSKLLASSMRVSQLSYAGTSTFTDARGDNVGALEFTLSGATAIAGLRSYVDCHDAGGGLQLIYVVEADGATVSGGVELFVSELAYTDASGAHDWSVTSPPPATGLLDDGVTITGVDATALATSIPSLTVTGQRTYAAFCGASPAAAPAPPAASASPSPAPSPPPPGPTAVSASPSPTPNPAASPSPTAQPGPAVTPSATPVPVGSPMPLP